MRLRFVAPGHEGQTCRVFGRSFPHGRWAAVDGLAPGQVERLAANPTFEVEGRPILRLPTPRAEA